MQKKLAIFGEFNPEAETHVATNAAIEHSLKEIENPLTVNWISTNDISDSILSKVDGMWIATGSPYKNMKNALKAIRFARQKKIPCFGTCAGFQHIMLEYAQAFLGIDDPGHEEYNLHSSTLFISKLTCSLRGKEMELNLSENSKVFTFYKSNQTKERYYCHFGINPSYVEAIKAGPINLAGLDSQGEIRIVEYPDHPFMIATLFVPQILSIEGKPYPLVTGFLNSIVSTTREKPVSV